MIETRIRFEDGKMVVENVQDVEDILERNKELRTMQQKSDWTRHVATIPNVILTRWLNEEWARGNTTIRLLGKEMDELVAKKLKDPEWAYLRTAGKQSVVGWEAGHSQ